MGIKVLRDAKARPYVAIVNGRIQRVRPKERYWALAREADAVRAGVPVQAAARAVSVQRSGLGRTDDDPPSSRWSARPVGSLRPPNPAAVLHHHPASRLGSGVFAVPDRR